MVRAARKKPVESSLEGQLLIAMPGMTDPRFERAVIFLCAHSSEGAMGLRINEAAADLSFGEVMKQLGILPPGGIRLPREADEMPVHRGGPVETGRGFVLHSADYSVRNSTLQIDDGICLTATLDILKAIVAGEGPRRALLALGYAGWSAGQLESELAANGWLHCPATPELVFGPEIEAKYEGALAQLGVEPGMLSSVAGHA